MPRFVNLAEMFVACPSSKLVLESISNNPKQQKISFDSLLKLISCVRANINQPTINAHREQLVDTPLAGWIEFIEYNKAQLNVMDAVSIQSFIDELVAAYGKIDPKLGSDLTQSKLDDRFRLLVRLTGKLKPNNRQFAMAQYCIGKMSK
jgi:hypothetical protein